jgi:pyridinium-3,5-biscarboxylic acid mononucleotide synthase
MSVDDQINLDLDRRSRTGLAEAIFCEGKSLEQLRSICTRIQTDDKAMLFTRLGADAFAALDTSHPGLLQYDATSRTAFVQPHALIGSTVVAIVAGGSSDVPVAREAARTLAFYGYPSLSIDDVGVAGLWRLMARLPDIRQHKIVICLAGMDAALPTVLGGLISSVIIAVPTSVGYGMVKGGETALRALLVSCAAGINVVNIDNGFGAACAAIRILNQFASTDVPEAALPARAP